MSNIIESKTLEIIPLKGDPVQKPILLRSEKDNPFIGYYGFTRCAGEKEHTGFDYKKKKGEPVLAVFSCNNMTIEVYVGHLDKNKKCALRSQFNEKVNNFDEETCKKCDNREGCYGLRIFLINGKKKVMYAHLSKINQDIFNQLKQKEVVDNGKKYDVYKIEEYHIKIGDTIGLTGNTGNAYSMEGDQQHLHFEYWENKKRCNPNQIVYTKFKLMKKTITNSENFLIGQNPFVSGSKEEWITMFKDRAEELKSGVDRYEIVTDDHETQMYFK